MHDRLITPAHTWQHIQLPISTSTHRIARTWLYHTCEPMCDYSTCMNMHMEVHVYVSTCSVITTYTEVHTYAHTVRDHWICHMMTLGPCRTPVHTTSLQWASAVRAHRSGSLHIGVEWQSINKTAVTVLLMLCHMGDMNKSVRSRASSLGIHSWVVPQIIL